ncbi:alpha/beta hydrolase family protein [Streptomyces sp. NPDC059524]|uniref:alpha/beta hydrolase family protein n=1 Tax=Streptomyces sp. NPDC059524 TaxID=3346856 RepID=UPI0036848923
MTISSRRSAVTVALALALSVPLLDAAATAAASPSPSLGAHVSAPTSDAGVQSPSPSPDAAVPELPVPGGAHPVGRRTLHLVDRSRQDLWVPKARGRELMVSLSYPARAARGAAAPYMTVEEARLLLAARGLGDLVRAETVAGIRTHAYRSAAPAPGRYPLVLLSPGFSMPRTTLTSLADELASRGYVVATVDHAYESVATEYPGHRILPCAACEPVDNDPVARAAAVRNRAADLSFVLDELGDPHRAGAVSRMIDFRRVGAAGHSIGGASAAATMAADDRVRAGVNLDGDFYLPEPGAGLGRRPFLMMGTADTHAPGSPGTDWPAAWSRLDGWKRWLTVTGSGHYTFTDLPYVAERLGLPDPSVPLSGTRSRQITSDYVAAFFDLHLRGVSAPLLDGPTAANPEVVFRHPAA